MSVRALAAVVLILAPAVSSAAPIVASTFDTGADGWEVGELYSTTGAGSPVWMPAGGMTGGFIRTDDIFGWTAFQAPASFLGDQSAAAGGSLQFFGAALTDDPTTYPHVVISNGSLRLEYSTPPPDEAWTFFSIPFSTGGWIISSGVGSGLAATDAQIQSVLANLLFLNISADWRTGSDQVDLDTVQLCARSGCVETEVEPPAPVPEPGSLLLMSGGLAGLIGYRARRRR